MATQIVFRTDAWEHDCAGGSINFGGGFVCTFENNCDCFPIIGCTNEDDDRAQCASAGAIDFRNDPPCQWNEYPPFQCGTFAYAVRVRWEYISIQAGSINSAPFSICGSGDPPLINSSANGTDGVAYQWQYQENCIGSWISVFGATASNYDPPVINNERCYRRLAVGCQFNGSSLFEPSNIIQYVNASPITNNTITANQNFCQNPPVQPNTLNGSLPSGGVGVLSYEWQESADNGQTWIPIPGTASLTYTPPPLSVNTLFRRRTYVAAGSCDNISNIIAVNITPALANNTISGNQTICINIDPSALPGSVPVGGGGISTYLYQWQQSLDNGTTWSDIFGANTQTYDPGFLSQTTQYRRTVTSGGCFDVSNTISVVILPALDNNFISSNQAFCGPSDPAALSGTTPTGGTGTYNFQWQESTDGLSWTDLIGSISSDYDPPLLTGTRYYRRFLSSGTCQSLSNIISVSIIPLLTNNTISGNQNYCGPSDPPVFITSAPNGATGTYDYLWQESIDGGTTWTFSAGGNVQIFDAPVLSQTTQYRRIVNSSACSLLSNVLTINITPVITDNVISGNQTFCGASDPVAFTDQLPGGGTGTYAYQWQESIDNGVTWGNISGAVNHDFDAPILSLTTQYRRVITSGNCTNISNPLVVTIVPVLGSNAISSDQFFCGPGDPALLNGTAPNGGTGSYTIFWQSSTDGGISWSVVSGANLQNYDPPLLSQTNLYRRNIVSGPCNTLSNNLLVDVTPVITNNSIGTSQQICGPSDPGVFNGSAPAGGTGSFTYQWQSSTDNGVTWQSIFGATSQDFDPSVISATTQFRRIVNSGSCSNTSNVIVIEIFPVISGNTISSDQAFCGDADPALLTGTAPTGGNGSYTYQWQESLNGGTSWSDVGGANLQNFDPPLLTQSRAYRRLISSSPCNSVSNVINVTITPLITSNAVTGSNVFCGPTDPASFVGTTPGGGNGSFAFDWQLSTDAGVSWSSIGGASSQNYDAPTVSATTQYRRITSSGSCLDVSSPITVTIVPPIANNAVASDQTFCGIADPLLLTGTATTGGTGAYSSQWQLSTNGGGVWSDVSGAVGQNYDPPATSVTTQYRRLVTSGVCSSVSNEALISITPVVTNNTITGLQIYCAQADPNPIVGTTAAGGTGTVVYQWEQSTNNGISWLPITGATAQDYDPGFQTVTTLFRRLAISGNCTDASNSVSVTVVPVIANNVINSDQSFCGATDPTILIGNSPSGGNNAFQYGWQSSTDGGASWSTVSGITSQNFDPPLTIITTLYRRLVSSSVCADTSLFVTIAITPAVTNNTISSPQHFCQSGDPVLLSGTIPSGGSGGFAYQWEQSNNGGISWTVVSGANSSDYDPPLLSSTTTYRRIAISGICNASSNTVTISITPNPVISGVTATDVDCSGAVTGQINVAATGGTGLLRYSINGGTSYQLSGSFSSLAAGSYQVFVTDDSSCAVPFSFNPVVISEPTAVNLTLSSTDPSCNGVANGLITAVSTGGVTPYRYSLNGSALQQNNIFSGLASGNYLITMVDANGCQDTTSVLLNNSYAITMVTDSVNDISCFGVADGYLSVLAQNGVTPYEYTINGFTYQSSPVFSGLVQGSYSVIVRDPNGCRASVTATITQPPLLGVLVDSVRPVSCAGLNDGAIFVSVSGGTLPYTFAWNNGAATEDNLNLGAGTFNLTITDANGCTATASASLSQPNVLRALLASFENVSCAGRNDGRVDLSVTGGTLPYTYIWSNGGNTEDINGLNGGTYNFTVTDQNGCSATFSQQITEPLPISASIAGTNILCHGANTGAVNLTVTGGSTPYQFIWSSGDTTEDISNTGPGIYTVVITDVNGCQSLSSLTLTQPSQLTASATVTQVSCFGLLNGAVDLTASGGTGSLTYSWSNGSVTQDLAAVPANTYTVTITDQNLCTITQTAVVNQPAALTLNAAVGNVQCNFSSSGFVNTTVTGGTSPYSYSWSNGSTSDDLFNVGSGNYNLTVTDARGCSATGSYAVNQSANNLNLLLSVTPVSCGGAANGAIDLTVTGGAAPLTYRWNTSQTTEDLNGISGGTYIVTVTDNNGCTASNGAQVIEPVALVAFQTGTVNVACNGNSTGSVNVSVAGGSPPYIYAWSNSSSNEDLLNAPAGNYTLIVTDARNCQDTVTATISQPPVLIANVSATNPGCNGATNGTATVAAAGGVQPYRYLWNSFATSSTISGLGSGNYGVIVTDANNCTVVASATLTNSGNLSVSIAATDISCNGQNNGSLTANPTGGTNPLSYAWSNGGNGQTLNGLPAGFYSVTATDVNGCTANASALVQEPDPLFLNLGSTDLRCFDLRNGQAIASAVGGTNPYTYSWNTTPVQTDIVADNLGPGTYAVTVTDANGCTVGGSVLVNSPPLLEVLVIDSNSSACAGQNNGQIEIVGLGGVAPYEYSVDGSQYASQTIYQGLDPGNHAIAVRDGNGCVAFGTARLNEPANLAVLLQEDTLIAFGDNALLNPIIVAEAGVRLIEWSPNVDISCLFCPNPVVSPANSQRYFVTVTDSNNCRVTAAIDVNVSRNYDVLIPSAFSPNGDGLHDLFGIIPIGINSVRMQIYNRWGELVFESTNPSERWDGTYRNKECPIGVYIYSVDVTYRDGRKEVKGGNATLLR